MGRHSDADRLAMVAEELAALAALLGDKPFMFGDRWANACPCHAYRMLPLECGMDLRHVCSNAALPCSPHAVDASVYGVLDQMHAAAMNPRLAELVAAHPNLVRVHGWVAARLGMVWQRLTCLPCKPAGTEAGARSADHHAVPSLDRRWRTAHGFGSATLAAVAKRRSATRQQQRETLVCLLWHGRRKSEHLDAMWS